MNLFILTLAELLNATCDLLQTSDVGESYHSLARHQLEEKTIDLVGCAIELYKQEQGHHIIDDMIR
jgi:hypothetical protein